jgi:NAD-dependent deacetylase
VVHLHGDIRSLHCLACESEWEIESRPYDRKGCPECGTRQEVKPAVVFFGEMAPRYQDLYDIVQDLRAQDTVVVVGTSGAVLPADRLFGESPAYSILVNLEPGGHMNEAAFSERLYGPATAHLPTLTAALRRRMD